MNEQHIHFTLTPQDRQGVDALLLGLPQWTVGLARCQVVLGAAYAGLACVRIARHHQGFLWLGVMYVLLACFWGLSGIWTLRRRTRSAGFAVEGALTVADAGISGSLDGTQVDVAWSRISFVRDLGGCAVIALRSKGRQPSPPIVIPWPSIADPAAFWRICEDHLIAKRGLIRPPGTRRMIVNTVG